MASEEHSEEVEHAIWRMHKNGEDAKSIVNKLKACDLFLSKRLINLAIRRGQLSEKMANNGGGIKPVGSSTDPDDPNLTDDVMEEMEIDADNVEKKDLNEEDAEITVGGSGGYKTTGQTGAGGSETTGHEPTGGETDESGLKPKARRMKTTDELILRLQEDFLQRPDAKVKDRAAKFGIAVGTLCQIKHNILKMPKESGRTWKSTPQMVEAISHDMQLEPGLKVKERALKFGISVGTLCRIMHDILELPKRLVQRSTGVRAPRSLNPSSVTMAATSARVNRKRQKRMNMQLPAHQTIDLSSGKKNVTHQFCLKSDGNEQVFVVTFDQAAGQMRFDQTGGAGQRNDSGTLTNVGSDEVVWVVNETNETNETNDVEHVPGEFEAEPESTVALTTETETETVATA